MAQRNLQVSSEDHMNDHRGTEEQEVDLHGADMAVVKAHSGLASSSDPRH